MKHLTPDELIDAVEGLLAPPRRAHLDACDACRAEVASLASSLADARQAPVPEPSPLFWDHLSARVQKAVAAEASPEEAAGWPVWSWRVLSPLAGLALVVLALVLAVPQPGVPPAGETGPEAIAAATDASEDWLLLAELVGPIDWDTASEAGLGFRPGTAERVVYDLTAEEQQELRRLLDAELRRPKS